MNNDDATIYNNDKNRNIFLAIRYSTSFIILRNHHQETLKPSSLHCVKATFGESDIHSTSTICLFYTRCLKERQKSESIL